MSFSIEEIKFYDELGLEVSGLTVPYTGILSKLRAEIFGSFNISFTDKHLVFDLATSTITNAEVNDFTNFSNYEQVVGKGFVINGKIKVSGSALNTGTFTITSISADGKTITVSEALVDEDVSGVTIYDVTPIIGIDFLYNLIPQNAQVNYLSLTDTSAIQRFSFFGVDASVFTPVNGLVSSSSFGWVTNELTNEITGETDEVYITGEGLVDSRQYFKIVQTFRVAPFFLPRQIINYQNETPVDYFTGENALKYICRIDGKYSFTGANIPQTGGITNQNGFTHWFNQNNIRSRPDAYYESISFVDVDSNILESIDINKVITVTIRIKSLAGLFFDNGGGDATPIILDFIYCPLNSQRIESTPNSTLIENFLNDRTVTNLGLSSNGEQYGTDYQVIKEIEPVLVDANTLDVIFKVDFSTSIKTFLKTLEKENRNYYFSVSIPSIDESF